MFYTVTRLFIFLQTWLVNGSSRVTTAVKNVYWHNNIPLLRTIAERISDLFSYTTLTLLLVNTKSILGLSTILLYTYFTLHLFILFGS